MMPNDAPKTPLEAFLNDMSDEDLLKAAFHVERAIGTLAVKVLNERHADGPCGTCVLPLTTSQG